MMRFGWEKIRKGDRRSDIEGWGRRYFFFFSPTTS
jgi:hypothetical protein